MCESSTSAERDAVDETSFRNQANPVCGTNSKYNHKRRRAAVHAYTWDDTHSDRVYEYTHNNFHASVYVYKYIDYIDMCVFVLVLIVI